MPDMRVDALDIARDLKLAGVKRSQADAIAVVVNRVSERGATKVGHLESSLAAVRAELAFVRLVGRWVMGAILSVVGILVGKAFDVPVISTLF